MRTSHVLLVAASVAAIAVFSSTALAAPTPRLVKDVDPDGGAQQGPGNIVATSAGLYFFVGGTATSSTVTMWKSDGTPAGTVPVRSFSVSFGAGAYDMQDFASVGHVVVFRQVSTQRLWRTDGTAAGTVQLAPSLAIEKAYGAAGGLLWFSDTSHRLWRSDGTDAGTLRVDVPSIPGSVGALGSTVIIGGYDTPDGGVSPLGATFGVWRSDGTPAGSQLLHTYAQGTFDDGVDLGAFFLFGAPTPGAYDTTLWKTNGTAAGTTAVGATFAWWSDVTAIGGRAYFWAKGSGASGPEGIWTSDGTAATTTLAIPASVVSPSTYVPNPILGCRGSLFFVGTRSGKRTVLRSDGTAAGTTAIDDSVLVSDSSPLTVANDSLVFWGSAVGSFPQLLVSDGTKQGTTALALYEDPTSIGHVVYGDTVYMSATNAANGRYALWAVTPDPPPSSSDAGVSSDAAARGGASSDGGPTGDANADDMTASGSDGAENADAQSGNSGCACTMTPVRGTVPLTSFGAGMVSAVAIAVAGVRRRRRRAAAGLHS